MELSRVSIVIPAYNEADTIGSVVQPLIDIFLSVVVIDDGSTDTTGDIAKKHGATVLGDGKNHGYDYSLQVGLNFAFSSGASAVITMDADGEHRFQDVIQVARYTEDNILVIGKRNETNRVSERFVGVISYLLTNVSDPLSGLKGISSSAYSAKNYIYLSKSAGMEIIYDFILRGGIVKEIPISINPREDQSRFGIGFDGEFKIITSWVRIIDKPWAIFLSRIMRNG